MGLVALVASLSALLPASLMGGCKDERARDPRATRRAELRDTVEPAPEDVAPPTTDVEPVEVVAVDVPVPDPNQVSEASCKAACQNALRVTLAELPADSAAAMRGEITRALEDTCPSQCVAKGSIDSVRCVAEARTALELAACPR